MAFDSISPSLGCKCHTPCQQGHLFLGILRIVCFEYTHSVKICFAASDPLHSIRTGNTMNIRRLLKRPPVLPSSSVLSWLWGEGLISSRWFAKQRKTADPVLFQPHANPLRHCLCSQTLLVEVDRWLIPLGRESRRTIIHRAPRVPLQACLP